MMTLSKYCGLTGIDIKKLRFYSDSYNTEDYEYEIKTISKLDTDGNIYWTALFPKIDGVVGGDTEVDAIKEAQENLKIYLWKGDNEQ